TCGVGQCLSLAVEHLGTDKRVLEIIRTGKVELHYRCAKYEGERQQTKQGNPRNAKTSAVHGDLLAWRFDNHAERVQRRAVLWRRRSFGCHSAAGCRFAERILTVVQTLRLQRRSILEFLYQAIRHHRLGYSTPKLILEG